MEFSPTENKRIATNFLELVVKGTIDEAYNQYVAMDGKHHNTFFAAGFLTLSEAMKKNHQEFPAKHIAIKHVIGEGDLVAVHSELTLRAGEAKMIVVHILRFRQGKIVEMWDCGQAIPHNSPNKDGAF